MDLVGKVFGDLVVLSKAEKRKNYSWTYNCRCKCGNEVVVFGRALVSGMTKSCGCLQREVAKKIGTKTIDQNSKHRIEIDKRYHTNISVIKDTDLMYKNNKSGVRGVCWDKGRCKWEAFIHIHGKKINLGRFVDKQDAIDRRKNAENEYFKPIVELAKQNKDI